MNNKLQQLGRTMMEMMVSLTLMAIVAIAVYGTFRLVVLKADARTLEQEITTRLVQLRHQALTKKGIVTPGPVHKLQASGMLLQAIDQTEHTFTLRVNSDVSALTFALCERLMKSASFSPWNKDACQEDKDYADFIFPKVADLEKFSDLPTFECGIYAHKEGEDCVCDEGYENWVKDEGCDLIGLECGAHAHRKWDGCQCDEGYEGWTEDEGCSKGCSKDSECSTDDECSACVIPEGQTKGMCRFACTEKGYLEGTGSQYIDTGVKPSSNTKVQVRFMYKNWNGATFIGRYNTVSESNSFRFFNAGTHDTYLDYGSGAGYIGRISTSSYIVSKDKIYETEFGNHYIKDMTSGTTVASGSKMSFSQRSYSIALWASSSEKGRIYYTKIYDGNALVRDFVPVLDPKGVPAMYDQKEKKLYYNKGSGQFLYGDDTGVPAAAGPQTMATSTSTATTAHIETGPTYTNSYNNPYSPGSSYSYSYWNNYTTTRRQTYTNSYNYNGYSYSPYSPGNNGYTYSYKDNYTTTRQQTYTNSYNYNGATPYSYSPYSPGNNGYTYTYRDNYTTTRQPTYTNSYNYNLSTPYTSPYTMTSGWVKWIQPKLTSNGTMGSSDFACSQSNILNSNHYCYRAFDNTTDSYWHSSNSATRWISWYTKNPIRIKSITITNRYLPSTDPANNFNYTVKDFTIQYSDDNANWYTVYSGSNPKGVLVTTTYYVNATTAHRYWRLNASSNHSSGSDKYVSIDELTIDADVWQ